MEFSANVAGLEPSATLAIASYCKRLRDEGREIIDLSAGEPDFRTPDFAAQAGIASINQGFTHYTPVAGVPVLRQTIAEHLATLHGRDVDPAAIVVSSGAKQAFFNACFVLFGPGDRVLLPSPYWTSYPEILRIARAETDLVPTTLETGFKVTVADLEKHVTPETKGLVLNSPSNPTGAVYTRAELATILEWAAGRKLWVISDEIYSRICFTAARADGVLDLDPKLLERVVMIDGASKALAMTGWRIGYSWSHPKVASEMAALQSHVTTHASAPAQYAAIAAFKHEPRVEHAVKAMVGVFRHRRERLLSLFSEHMPAARFAVPDGAFYLFFNAEPFFTEAFPDSVSFCRWLLGRTGVALVPGEAFGDDRYVRLSFAAPEDELVEGVRRMGEAVAMEPSTVG